MIYDSIIIGAGPAGLSAAVYLKQAGKKILILEKNTPGGKLLKTNKINNYLGFNEVDSSTLAYNMYNQVINLGVEIKIESVIDILNGEEKIVKTNKNEYKTKTILITCGRVEKELDIKASNISYCAKCDGSLYKNKTVMLIGNNKESIDDMNYLSNIVSKLIYVNNSNEEVTSNKDNILIINNKEINKYNTNNNIITSVLIDNQEYKIDGLFIENGYTPNIDFLKSLKINMDGNYILANEKMLTSKEGIYAAGDIIKKDVYQVVTAASDGAIAALSIIKHLK